MKIAVSGFRHGHMGGIVKEMHHYAQIQIVAACEPQPEKCENIIKNAGVTITHKNFDDMLKNVEFDALAVGDVYADRGAQVIKALEAGKHILGDKPLCTRPEEIRRIRALATEKKRSVIVALTLRYNAAWQTARKLLREGAIGEVCTATVHGQHPLNYKAGRPEWYFEKGRHGGTICDLMVHGIDSLAFLTGSPVAEIVAARAWHKEPIDVPFFQDCAQAMFRLANNAGVIMEASYKVPKGHPAPWSATFWGTLGALELNTSGVITLKRAGEAAKSVEATLLRPGNCIEDFLAETGALPGRQQELTTAESLDASEKAVLAQAAADEGRTHQRV